MFLTKIAFPLSGLLFLHLLIMFTIPPSAFSHSGGFEFLAQLQGCGKGDTLKGVNQLKQYLQSYGYLDNHADAAAHEDEFDEVVESAVKTYQLNYHLNTSGVLDMQTIKLMMKPRCGVPDIINGTTRMLSGKKNNKNRKLSLHTVSHYSFFSGNPKWPQTHLTYRMGPRVDEVVGLGTLRPILSRAFEQWAAVSTLTFQEDQGETNILIDFERGDHGDGLPFDVAGRRAIAHAFGPTSGIFHYNADNRWSANPDVDEFDLESVAVHEIGHLLGLDHSSDHKSVMFSFLGTGKEKRQLNEDDVRGIQALYN